MVRMALAQINVTVGDLDGNIKKMAEFMAKAVKRQADVIVFPELAITGYPPEDLLLKEHFVSDNLKALQNFIKQTQGITAIVGFVDRDKKKNLYNAAAIIYDGSLKGVYHKMALPNYGVFDEKRYFTPGTSNAVYALGPSTFGISICEDIWQENGPHVNQAKAGAKVLINISSSPFHAGKSKVREKLLIDCAKKTKSFICYVNLVGGQDELVFDGGSYVFSPQGKLLASGRPCKEDLIFIDIETKTNKKRSIKNVRHTVVAKELNRTKKEPLEKQIAHRPDTIEEVYNALVLGTRDYIQKNGFKRAVVGLSGGIDSSITAVIACDAIGRENVVGVSMPSRFSSHETQNDAKKLAENLQIQFMEISIERIVDVYQETLEKEFLGLARDITEENLQARIRGNILMAFSNKFGWLVLTTGNKSEIATGYCTLYGDMAGGFAVIKDVPKTMIYDLVRFRDAKEKNKLIPQSVLDRAPTAELRENQKDQDTLPAYNILDQILKSYVEGDQSFSELTKHHEAQLVQQVMAMVDKSEYKRRQAPPGVKITPRAFGRDRRLPITNRYKEL